jgi:ribosome-associated toxin RatA of RatAB toxin-antitoxin module
MAQHTESRITIQSSPAQILQVIADLQAYPQWSDGIASVEILESQNDRPTLARFVLDAGIIKDTYELAYTWNEQTSVSWTLVSATVLTVMDGSYQLSVVDEGVTDVTYALSVDIKMPMLGMLKRKAEQTIVETALKGLKVRVENHGSTSR